MFYTIFNFKFHPNQLQSTIFQIIWTKTYLQTIQNEFVLSQRRLLLTTVCKTDRFDIKTDGLSIELCCVGLFVNVTRIANAMFSPRSPLFPLTKL